jgi:hypothetical protein
MLEVSIGLLRSSTTERALLHHIDNSRFKLKVTIFDCSLCGGLPLHTLIPRVGRLEVVVARGELMLRSLKYLTS